MTARIAWRPNVSVLQFDVVLDIGDAGAGRVFAFLHGQGIKERLESGTDLTACLCDMVVLEETIVQAADVSLHMTRVRLDGNEAGLQEPLVISDGIHRRHDRVDGAFPRKDGHWNGTVENGFDGIHRHPCVLEIAVTLGALHRCFKDMVDFVGGHVGERRVFLALPMLVEHGLQLIAHELFDGFLGVMLHS